MTDADQKPAVVGQVERPVRPRVMLTHKDLCALADAAARNGTLHAFPALALEWASGAQIEIARLREALTELRDRIKDHPAYADLTEAEEIETGGDTAELSYLARVADAALGA